MDTEHLSGVSQSSAATVSDLGLGLYSLSVLVILVGVIHAYTIHAYSASYSIKLYPAQGVPTEREVHTTDNSSPVYRVLLTAIKQ